MKIFGIGLLVAIGLVCFTVSLGLKGGEEIPFVIFAVVLAVYFTGRLEGHGIPEQCLPKNSFIKLSEHRFHEFVLLVLIESGSDPGGPWFYKIQAESLLDKNGNELKQLPEVFTVKPSKIIIPKEKFNKHPRTKKIYYIVHHLNPK